MPHTVIETATFDIPVTVPDAGDSRTAASVNIPFQALANRTNYLKAHLDALEADTLDARIDVLEGRYENGSMQGNGNMWSSDLSHIVMGSIQSLDIGSHHFGPQPDTTITPTLGGVSRWYYLYAYNNSGTLAFQAYEASGNQPAPNLVLKNGDATRRFLCSFYVDASAQIRPFRKMGNKYTWRRSLIPFNDLVVTGGSFTNAGPTLRSLASFAPGISRMVTADLAAACTVDDHTAVLKVYSAADSGSGYIGVTAKQLSGIYTVLSADVETSAAQEITTELAGSASDGNVPTGLIIVTGYYE